MPSVSMSSCRTRWGDAPEGGDRRRRRTRGKRALGDDVNVPAERLRAEVPALQEQPFEARRMAGPLIARYPLSVTRKDASAR
ncbi:hypothetical protein [Rhodococcus sp. IEGM 1307]|uniref:hypothetical protein n=1 Tax=Rhodococcus sp. IEGM 1307 TaxID=3047091 RepID=UPI0024B76802|nr:hypothetical protein [Rhodococcus sp. IEGM 1307]MDI9973835.1 hypothetical protein [Rhodococcus sp. IEGM 1307]